MFENKKPDQLRSAVVQGLPGEISVPSGLPAEFSPSYPAPVIDPKAKIAKFVAPTPSMSLPPKHASIPPISTLGDGRVSITLPEGLDKDTVGKVSEGSSELGRPDLARLTQRQLDRAA